MIALVPTRRQTIRERLACPVALLAAQTEHQTGKPPPQLGRVLGKGVDLSRQVRALSAALMPPCTLALALDGPRIGYAGSTSSVQYLLRYGPLKCGLRESPLQLLFPRGDRGVLGLSSLFLSPLILAPRRAEHS